MSDWTLCPTVKLCVEGTLDTCIYCIFTDNNTRIGKNDNYLVLTHPIWLSEIELLVYFNAQKSKSILV